MASSCSCEAVGSVVGPGSLADLSNGAWDVGTEPRGMSVFEGALLVEEGVPPSALCRRSSKSVSRRPFDGRARYSERAGSESAYQALIIASTLMAVVFASTDLRCTRY